MFKFIDCDGDGLISSEDIWRAFQHLLVTPEIDLKPASTNDVVLKSDKAGNAKLNLAEFNRAIYIGYWQRMLEMKGVGPTFKKYTAMRAYNRPKNIFHWKPYVYGNTAEGVSRD